VKVWKWLTCFVRLCSVMRVCDRCMVPIPLRPALELNVLGAPGATSMTSCAPLGTQDATNQYKPVDILTQIEILQSKLTKPPNPRYPRPFACRRGVTPQSYLAGSWVHYGRLSHFDPTLHDKFVWSSWVSIFFKAKSFKAFENQDDQHTVRSVTEANRNDWLAELWLVLSVCSFAVMYGRLAWPLGPGICVSAVDALRQWGHKSNTIPTGAQWNDSSFDVLLVFILLSLVSRDIKSWRLRILAGEVWLLIILFMYFCLFVLGFVGSNQPDTFEPGGAPFVVSAYPACCRKGQSSLEARSIIYG